jgi:hypothetical protein
MIYTNGYSTHQVAVSISVGMEPVQDLIIVLKTLQTPFGLG